MRLGIRRLTVVISVWTTLMSPLAAQAVPFSIASSVAQSGIDQSIGNAPLAVVNEPGFDFVGQDYRSLRSVDRVSITLTLLDGDSAVGDRDFGKLTLMLEGVNTGILLNGFRDSELDTLTITGFPSDEDKIQILAGLQVDGHVSAWILSTDQPSFNRIGVPSGSNATLVLTGDRRANINYLRINDLESQRSIANPEPSTWLLLLSGLVLLGGYNAWCRISLC
ncbi:PEP-CTERM sorting domain-containing protein [Nitrospira sp. Nam74]